MLSQYSAPLLDANPAEWPQEREEMAQERSRLRGQMDRAKLVIDESPTVDETVDEGPRPAAVVRGEKMQ